MQCQDTILGEAGQKVDELDRSRPADLLSNLRTAMMGKYGQRANSKVAAVVDVDQGHELGCKG